MLVSSSLLNFQSLASWALQETREGKEILPLNRKQSVPKRETGTLRTGFYDVYSAEVDPRPAVPRGWDKGVFLTFEGGGGWLTKHMPGSSDQWLDCV